MGKVTRKRHPAEFKAKVALEAMRGEQTLAGPGAKYGIHQAMIAAWRRQTIDRLTATFAGRRDDPKGGSLALRSIFGDMRLASKRSRAGASS